MEAQSGQSHGLEEKERQISEQGRHIAKLEAQQQELRQAQEQNVAEKEHELNEKQERIEDLEDQLQAMLEGADNRKGQEIRELQRQLHSVQSENQAELESLRERVKLAESHGDNQVQLAQQAANDARQKVLDITRDKGVELELLQARVDTAETKVDELDDYRKKTPGCYASNHAFTA